TFQGIIPAGRFCQHLQQYLRVRGDALCAHYCQKATPEYECADMDKYTFAPISGQYHLHDALYICNISPLYRLGLLWRTECRHQTCNNNALPTASVRLARLLGPKRSAQILAHQTGIDRQFETFNRLKSRLYSWLNPDYALDSLYKIILASNPLQ